MPSLSRAGRGAGQPWGPAMGRRPAPARAVAIATAPGMTGRMTAPVGWLLALLLTLLAVPAAAAAPDFPALTGRVVDAADVLSPDVEAALTAKLEAVETSTGHQLVVATVPSLDGRPIEDYGYQLGRTWGIGSKDKDDGAILLVAPNDRKVRIEVGYGLEPVLTDAMSGLIIRERILPAFRDGDLPGGVEAGVDAIAEQIGLPPEEAQARAAAATQASNPDERRGEPGFGALIWFLIILFWIFVMGSRRGRRSGMGGLGWFLLGQALGAASRGRSSGWSGGGGFGGGGGFSGGGGSFGGGGASGGW